MMRYNTIKPNDVANAPGISISVYLQGCPHHCKGCFNPETWSYEGGKPLTAEIVENEIIAKLNENDIKRNLCILGGEPLSNENLDTTLFIITNVLHYMENKLPKIYIWTGYTIEELIERINERDGYSELLSIILTNINVLIDGPFIEEQKDLSLKMRGSRNQRIIEEPSLYVSLY